MSILSGREILRQVEAGAIEIDPFVREHVNPASVDLTLGSTVREYVDVREPDFVRHVHDVKVQHPLVVANEIPASGMVLRPGRLYLMHTVERLCAKNLVSELTGKSSIARLGVVVHLTAGFGDPHFRGQYTLEVVAFRSVRLYAGMRICQMVFHEVVGEIESYQERGHYAGEQCGPVPSMVHKQFEKSDPWLGWRREHKDGLPCQGKNPIDCGRAHLTGEDPLTPGERAYIEETIRHLGGK